MVSAYHESVRNAAISMVSPDGMYVGGDILPDLFTGNAVFNLRGPPEFRVQRGRDTEPRRTH